MKIDIFRSWKRRQEKIQKPKRGRQLKRKAAALAIGLATAWGGAENTAEAQDYPGGDFSYSITTDPSVTLTNAVVIFNTNSSNVPGFAFPLGGSFPSGSTRNGVLTVPPILANDCLCNPNPEDFTFLAVYSSGAQSGVALASQASIEGSSWSSLFESSTFPSNNFPEATIQTFLEDGPISSVVPFSAAYRGTLGIPLDSTDVSIYAFSNATLSGSITFTAVPEPSTLGIVILAAAFVTSNQRRRRD